MTKKETTSIKLNKEVKDSAKKILKELGFTMEEAIAQVTLNKGLPFEAKIPNKTTQKVIKEVRRGKNVEKVTLDKLKSN